MEAERQEAIVEAEKRLSARLNQEFHQLLETAQQAACTREDALFDVGLAWTPMRRIAVELGRRLAEKGVIATAEDVFWLQLDEMCVALTSPIPVNALTVQVTGRQAANKLWSQSKAPYLLPEGSKPSFWWKWIFPTP